ncbi:MAG: esterase [Acidobacteria bacterium]|nr:esterase [Acidobacteriota bacterium]
MRNTVAALVLLTSFAYAQAPAKQAAKKVATINPAARAAALALKSPEVHPDRTVTFRYRAPNAKQVEIYLEGRIDNMPMTKDAQGVWTLTVGPLEPEYYGYRVIADDVKHLDPMDPNIRTNLQSPSSFFLIPGNPPRAWERTDVPHGEVHHHLYRSKLANDDRDIWVYTPPNYDEHRKEKYPVLYLLHGYSDDAEGWITNGNANYILDNLIAEGKVKPMVIVMPLAYGTMEMITKGWNVWTGKYEVPTRNQEMFADQLIHEVLPLAESKYNIATDAAHRAIAGLSMGGGHTLYTGLNHPDVFGYVAAMSSAIINKDYDHAYSGRNKARLKLFWISCGTEDSLIKTNRDFEAWAKTNVNAEAVSINETPGMHTWLVWRQNLISIAPMLFTQKM